MREIEMKTLNTKRWLGLSALLGSLLVVAGCSLAPTYTKPDVSAPPPGPVCFGQPGDAFVIQQNLSAVGNVEPREAREQRRFSAS